MSELADLERRITSALERIGRGVENMQSAANAPADTSAEDALQQALEEERTANAQLTERVKALKEKQDTTIAGLQAQVAALRARAEQAEATVAQAPPPTDTSGLTAEIAALKTARAADAAEMDAILADLKSIAEGDTHA